MFHRTVRMVYEEVKAEHHGTVTKLTKNMTVCMDELRLNQYMKLGWLD